MVRFIFILLVIGVIVAAFAGVEPLSTYKDTAFNKVSEWWESLTGTTENITSTKSNATNISQNPTSTTSSPKPTGTEQKALSIGKEVVAIVNDIRVERGTPKLIWDETLYKYSLEHSQAMAQKRDLFHSDMNMPYAENTWLGEGSKFWGAETIVESWMDSPKHRTWLLCPSLKHIAVGVAYSSNGMYASWTFWRNETTESDWWYQYTPDNPPSWWY